MRDFFCTLFLVMLCAACEKSSSSPLETIKLLHGTSECLRIDHPSKGPSSHVCSESIQVADGAVRVCFQKWRNNGYAINLPCKDYDAIKNSMLKELK